MPIFYWVDKFNYFCENLCAVEVKISSKFKAPTERGYWKTRSEWLKIIRKYIESENRVFHCLEQLDGKKGN